ncbi:MAG: PBSX family phage terminase large subunit [Ruminococcus sp.]|nr:PBSX family phage terminase large subunit [Ruminococcus sp.]
MPKRTEAESGTEFKFSPKQIKLMRWWTEPPTCCLDGVICDGAVRSGKTTVMTYSFIMWAMAGFDGASFAICGKTISSARRNILDHVMKICSVMRFGVKYRQSQSRIDISMGGRSNTFYLFGGKDEGSAALIQGMTLGGVLFDETALMPRSFVEQAVARCSLPNSKLWFNCNPAGAGHWFKREWLDKANEKRMLVMHFGMNDNPSLTMRVRKRYERLYSGAFYDRFILGRWCDVTGLIYPMFSPRKHTVGQLPERFEKYIVSCDYGTVNPSSFGLWGLSGGVWYRIAEYYYDSRREGMQRTDEEHYAALEQLTAGRKIDCILVDPAAASFITCIQRHGRYSVRKADNDVLGGISRVADMLNRGVLKFSEGCSDCIREFGMYRWDDSAAADRPLKENDHAMDDVRYFVNHISKRGSDSFFVMALERG